MADLDNSTTIIIDDERPIALRRTRRSSVGPNTHSRSNSQAAPTTSNAHGIATPPATPKRSTKKQVRFSDLGPAIESDFASSGLTPFIRRTSLSSTPKSHPKRRHTTPAKLWHRAGCDVAPLSGTIQFAPLRQVLDGRVKRRIRRNGLSEEVNIIEGAKRTEAKGKKSEVDRLKAELVQKDLEVQRMRDEHEIASQIEGESGGSITTNTTLSIKVVELEQEIRFLKEELSRREQDGDTIVEGEEADWTMAARDPYAFDGNDGDNDDEMIITNYDEEFQDMTGYDEMITTPTRLNTSFPSPPSTMPNTPCKSICSMNAGIQASLPIPDPEKEILKSQLQALQSEIAKLTSSVAFNADHHDRLAAKLSSFIPTNESHDHSTLDSALDTVLTALALSQSQALEHSTAFSALSSEITSLGFPAASPDAALEILSKQFRQARLDLEYLMPGEVAEGFENEKLLGLLVERVRTLVSEVKERDESIDQYHEQEVLLRQQLNARVSVMDRMKRDLVLANSVVGDLREEVKEKDVDSERLRAALDGYREEVSGLEKLIERVEKENRENDEGLRSEMDELQRRLENEICQHDVTKAVSEGNELVLAELERRLTTALEAAAELNTQLSALTSTHTTTVAERDAALAQLSALSSSSFAASEAKNAAIDELKSTLQDRETAHGSALALRDARVSELRSEIERVNDALKVAHTSILGLRRENGELVKKAERGQFIVRDMLKQVGRAEEMGRGFVDAEVATAGIVRRESGALGMVGLSTPRAQSEGPVVRKGGMFDSAAARRSSGGVVGKSGKKRRRYDSGLGFLEEEGEVEMSIEM